MNVKLKENADTCYREAEQKAAKYFKLLQDRVRQKEYIPILTKDIRSWKHNHIHQYSLNPFKSNKKQKPDTKNYHNYIKWLDYMGKLDNYLDRSFSYLYLRDLGKTLDSKGTKLRIKRTVDNWKKHLKKITENNDTSTDMFSMASLYRKAQKEGIESTMIWLTHKLKVVSENIPDGMDADHAQRKLIKIIAGVLMHELEEMDEDIATEERKKKLDQAIRLGYSYGLTYPFIDDLLDANILTKNETKQYSNLIRRTLVNRSVPALGDWPEKNVELLQYIHNELREAFQYIIANQRPDTLVSFFEQSYIFFQSQEEDRMKDLSNPNYSNEELYIPVILKSASSRLIVRSVISAPEDEGFHQRTFYYGIYNQLADDFADMFDDLKDGAVTPYTYYLKYHKERPDLINPFELYWTVISYLLHDVYKSDRKTREVMLDRAINGLKRYKERMGTERYNEVMDLFTSDIPTFNHMIQKMVHKADDVDFFDKLLRDHMVTNLKKDREEQKEFIDTIESVRMRVHSLLPINKNGAELVWNDPIMEAANYSLEGSGKRLRPIMTWFMCVRVFGLEESTIAPLLKSIEYMHTASLIFDDLPSQDNASTRRGSPTLHKVHNVAVAELTGLFLTQKAIGEQATLNFDSNRVLPLIQYSTQVTEDMCKGQIMDLESKGKQLSLEQLNRMCFYKTGLAFEASLLMPAILAGANEKEMEALKKYAYHAGIAFQIKDDLLDTEGDQKKLGKDTGIDIENNNSTFVTILGLEEAKMAMWEHYCQAMEILEEMPQNLSFLKHLMNYIVYRDN